jgi:2-dehydropantoate 2-reductase
VRIKASAISRDNVGRNAGGSAFVTGTIVASGVICQTGTYQQMTFGELDGELARRAPARSVRCGRLRRSSAPISVPLIGLNALTRLPLGKWRDLFALADASLRETIAVGLAEGVVLPPDIEDRTLAAIRSMPAYHMTSMGNDLLRGNRLELPWFAGKVVELGRRHGIQTPVNGFVYAALKPFISETPT